MSKPKKEEAMMCHHQEPVRSEPVCSIPYKEVFLCYRKLSKTTRGKSSFKRVVSMKAPSVIQVHIYSGKARIRHGCTANTFSSPVSVSMSYTALAVHTSICVTISVQAQGPEYSIFARR